jgi:hypothetical protein
MTQREEIADNILTELHLMNISIRAWVEKKGMKCHRSLSRKAELKEVLDKHHESLQDVSQDIL